VFNKLLRVGVYFRPDLPVIAGAFLLFGLNLAAGLLKPWPLAWIIDHLLAGRPAPPWLANLQQHHSREVVLLWLCGAVLGLHLCQALVAAIQNYAVITAGLRGLARLRQEVFHWLQRLSLRRCQGARQGDLIHRAVWDTYAIQTLFQQGFYNSLSASLSLLAMVWIMLRLDWRLTLLALGTLPLLLLAMRQFGHRMGRESRQAHQADSQVTSAIQQTITTLPLIQSFTRESREADLFSRCVDLAYARRKSQHGWEVGYLAVIGILFGLGTTVIIWFGARQVITETLSVGELLVFLAYMAQFYDPLNQLSRVGSTAAEASADVDRVFELLDTPEEIRNPINGRSIVTAEPASRSPVSNPPPLVLQGALEFDQVVFGYRKNQPVLHHLSLSVPAGQCIAIVGPSGVGKSTLLHLVPRFFDPDAGCVRLDGADISQLKLADLRAQVGLVMQEPILVPGSVRDNLALARPDSSLTAIQEAARAAQADQFIESLPQKYDTLIGDGALRLSVGEQQRLSLARVFLKNAPLLLLDEPTSALDVENERWVLEGLKQLIHGRTTLIAAHRPASIQLAHQVTVLENGQVTAFGPLDHVIRESPFLRQLLQA
jgi:ATP-binding cassette subfamily B protein/subfamily B ATP-binding cassette protein MsbA